MKYVKKINNIFIIATIISIVCFVGCQPNVRFSNNIKHSGGDYSTDNTTAASKTHNIDTTLYNIPAKTIYPKPTINANSYKIISIAQKWLGTPYLYGGNTKSGVDCSGFVKNIYSEIGINLPRTSAQQFQFAIPTKSPAVGDLVFFKKKGKINHVAIYLGNDRIIHSSINKGVIEQTMTGTNLEKMRCGYGKAY
ncbi:MAG: C40 family peptidase [Ignavibacteria bacterium]|jgi:cell wall-associated NlpC family hydrolase|nr:C40 family peptidase [Ignavibacteria bacterium]